MTVASIDTSHATPHPTGQEHGVAPSSAPPATRLWERLRGLRLGPVGLIGPAVAVVSVGAIGPLVILVLYSFGVLGDLEPAGLSTYGEIVGDGYYWGIYWKSLKLALSITAIAVVVATPLAFIISSSSGWKRTLLVCAVVMPLMVNVVVRNLGWVIVLTNSGVLNRILDPFGLEQNLLGSLTGIGVVLVHIGVPLVILPMLTSIDRLDRSQIEAAKALGAHPIVAFWRITVPRIAVGMIAGSTLVFLIAMGSLVTPRFLGQGKVTVVPTLIVQQIRTFRWERTAALSILLFLLVLVYAVFVQRVAGRLSHGRSTRARGRGHLLRPRPVTALAAACNRLPTFDRGQRAFTRIYTWVAVAYLLFPMAIILKSAVDSSSSIQVGFDGFTLRWFEEAFSDAGFGNELWFSLRLAFGAVLLSLVLSLAASWAIARFRFPGRDGIIALLMSPLLVPQASLAIGFVLFFLWMGTSPSFERMLFAHLVITIPYMCRMLVTAFESVEPPMEEAAASLGARPLTVFRKVTLPLIRPGLFAAVLYGFLVSFDEAAISVLLASGSTTTFPVKLLAAMEFNPTPVGAAISALLIIGLSLILVPLERRFGIASNAAGGRG
jgi:putative spermidine/putrescine transport system permease protein